MFRHVTEFVNEPRFLILCSHLHCGSYAHIDVKECGGENTLQAQQNFIATLQINGWAIGLDAMFCPQHVRKARAQQTMIQVPQLVVPN